MANHRNHRGSEQRGSQFVIDHMNQHDVERHRQNSNLTQHAADTSFEQVWPNQSTPEGVSTLLAQAQPDNDGNDLPDIPAEDDQYQPVQIDLDVRQTWTIPPMLHGQTERLGFTSSISEGAIPDQSLQQQEYVGQSEQGPQSRSSLITPLLGEDDLAATESVTTRHVDAEQVPHDVVPTILDSSASVSEEDSGAQDLHREPFIEPPSSLSLSKLTENRKRSQKRRPNWYNKLMHQVTVRQSHTTDPDNSHRDVLVRGIEELIEDADAATAPPPGREAAIISNEEETESIETLPILRYTSLEIEEVASEQEQSDSEEDIEQVELTSVLSYESLETEQVDFNQPPEDPQSTPATEDADSVLEDDESDLTFLIEEYLTEYKLMMQFVLSLNQTQAISKLITAMNQLLSTTRDWIIETVDEAALQPHLEAITAAAEALNPAYQTAVRRRDFQIQNHAQSLQGFVEQNIANMASIQIEVSASLYALECFHRDAWMVFKHGCIYLLRALRAYYVLRKSQGIHESEVQAIITFKQTILQPFDT